MSEPEGVPTRCCRERRARGAVLVVDPWLGLPVVSIAVGFRGGAFDEPEHRLGLTDLLVRLVAVGRGPDGSLTDFIRSLGGDVATTVEPDAFGFAVTVLSRDFAHALEALGRVLESPPCSEADLATARVGAAAERALLADRPVALALRELVGLAFRGHPYGRPIAGTAETLGAVTRDDVVAWHEKVCRVGDLVVSAVGDVSVSQARGAFDRLAERLPAGKGRARWGPTVPVPTGLVTIPIHTRDRSVVAVAFSGPPAGRSDAAQIIARALSGCHGRLGGALRDRPPHAYGVGAAALSLRLGGLMMAHAMVRPGLEELAVRAIVEEFRRLATDGLADSEFEEARRDVIATLEGRAAMPAGRAAVYAMGEVLGAFAERPEEMRELVGAARPDDVARLARTHYGSEAGFATAILRAPPGEGARN